MNVKANFRPVKTRRIFEEICEQIRQELLSGTLKPGDRLPSERDLAAQFGVSRTAVREAFRSLENAGVIRLQTGTKGGAVIIEGSPEAFTQSIRDMMSIGRITLDDLTEARVVIVDVVVRLAVERRTNDDIVALERNIELTAEYSAPGMLAQRGQHSLQFYRLLAAATRNEVLVVIVDSLSEILVHFIYRAGPAKDIDLVASRRRFLEHFRAGNADAASLELHTHLTAVHGYLMQPGTKPPRATRTRLLKTAR